MTRPLARSRSSRWGPPRPGHLRQLRQRRGRAGLSAHLADLPRRAASGQHLRPTRSAREPARRRATDIGRYECIGMNRVETLTYQNGTRLAYIGQSGGRKCRSWLRRPRYRRRPRSRLGWERVPGREDLRHQDPRLRELRHRLRSLRGLRTSVGISSLTNGRQSPDAPGSKVGPIETASACPPSRPTRTGPAPGLSTGSDDLLIVSQMAY